LSLCQPQTHSTLGSCSCFVFVPLCEAEPLHLVLLLHAQVCMHERVCMSARVSVRECVCASVRAYNKASAYPLNCCSKTCRRCKRDDKRNTHAREQAMAGRKQQNLCIIIIITLLQKLLACKCSLVYTLTHVAHPPSDLPTTTPKTNKNTHTIAIW
jgi:hypothetical protein